MPEQTHTVVRLTPEVYKSLEAKFSRPTVTDSTSAHQAGFQLGVQAVLQALRQGFVVEA